MAARVAGASLDNTADVPSPITRTEPLSESIGILFSSASQCRGRRCRGEDDSGEPAAASSRSVTTKPGRDSIVGRAMKVDGKESSEQQRAQPRTGRVKTKTASPQSSFI